MAKKTAPKKKSAAGKAKPSKAGKAVKKSSPPVKAATKAPVKLAAKTSGKSPAKVEKKPAPKILKPIVKAAEKPVAKAAVKEKPAAKKSEPALMTKNGKAEPEERVVNKQPTVISMLEESSTPDDSAKAEKVSKIKPVKIERGNLADEKAKWAELYKKYGKEKAVTYKMSDTFTTMVPMQHKVLGWGFVLTNENDRLEVLFETGIRMLISNYKV